MFGLVYIEFWMVHLGYRMVYFVFWMVYLVLSTVYFIFCTIFHFKWLVFGDLDDGIGILDGDYVICNDFLLTERKYLVFLILHLV